MNLTAIVDSLLDSPLHEDDDLFLSEIKAADLDVVGAEMESVVDSSVMVKWRADSEYRSWGIKSIDPVIVAVNGWIELETIEDQPRTSTLPIDGFSADCKVDEADRSGIYLYPQSAEINLRNRTILVHF
jgi:hypothetical protein